MLNRNPRERNRANGEFGEARDTKHGNCRPTRPARVIEQSLSSSKNCPSMITAITPISSRRHFLVGNKLVTRLVARAKVVSFAAVIRVVTQCSSPTNGCSLELYIPFLKLTNKDQASISWKPGPLAANVTRNMIGAAANSCMHVVGSQ